MHDKTELVITGQDVSLRDLYYCVVNHHAVRLSDDVISSVETAYKFLHDQIEGAEPIYGVTTGFGPLANTFISHQDACDLQKNLIRMVSTGVGPPVSETHARGGMLARLISLSRGHSGVRVPTLHLLADFMNHNIVPIIPKLGTVGASGDLAPMAHMALCLIGEGDVVYQGRTESSSAVLKRLGLQPLDPQPKEGLALINGTPMMTGIAAINDVLADKLVKFALAAAVMYSELFHVRKEAFHPLIAEVRNHPGQYRITTWINALLGSSDRIRDIGASHQAGDSIQDVYSIRCIPQVFGGIQDCITFHHNVVLRELNSVTDNPLIFPREKLILSGGNFMGTHVALASDNLSNAVVNLANHAERIVARIVDPVQNNTLPPYLQPYKTGLHSGFMSAQVSATSLIGYMRSLAIPASVQSIPTNGNNQDIVSMGTIASQKTSEILYYAFRLVAIELIALTQAFEIAGGFQKNTDFCGSSRMMARRVREISEFVSEDRPLYKDFESVANHLASDDWEADLNKYLGL